jgi:hypothetical protein
MPRRGALERWIRGHRVLTVVVAAAAILTPVILFVAPFPRAFALHDQLVGDDSAYCQGISPPDGSTVSFQWASAAPTHFLVVSCEGGATYTAYGTGGSGRFAAWGGTYELGGQCIPGSCVPANISGSYTAPLLGV